jgi:RimJ/RimL family protein N-acetyltransferase
VAPLDLPTLEEGSLRVRPLRDGDVEAIHDGRQDAEIARWLAGSPWPYTLEYARAAVARSKGEPQPGAVRSYAIEDVGTGELYGAVMVRPVRDPPEIGYWLKREARGRGRATRALELASRWLLEQDGVELIELMTHPDNAAAQRVAERAGYERAGIVERYATWRDGCTTAARFVLRRRVGISTCA